MNAVIPLFDESDNALSPFLYSKLFSILMTFQFNAKRRHLFPERLHGSTFELLSVSHKSAEIELETRFVEKDSFHSKNHL